MYSTYIAFHAGMHCIYLLCCNLLRLFCCCHKVVSFDGSTTVSEFLVALEKSIGVRESSLSGFALFSDDPTVPGVEHCLQADAKVFCLWCATLSILINSVLTMSSIFYCAVDIHLCGTSSNCLEASMGCRHRRCHLCVRGAGVLGCGIVGWSFLSLSCASLVYLSLVKWWNITRIFSTFWSN